MRLVQTALAEEEYHLLAQRASREGKSMKQVAREALRAHLLPDVVDSNDPIFRALPVLRGTGRKTWHSRDHDDLLYPAHR